MLGMENEEILASGTFVSCEKNIFLIVFSCCILLLNYETLNFYLHFQDADDIMWNLILTFFKSRNLSFYFST